MQIKNNVGRRTVLQSIGAGAAVGSLVGLVAGQSGARKRVFSGISYEVLSHKLAGSTTAIIETNENGRINGSIRLGGFTIDASMVDIKQVNRETLEVIYGATLDSGRYKSDNLPLLFQMVEYSTGITGSITRPNPEYGSLGFTMADDVFGRTESDLAEGLWNKGDGIVPEGYGEVPDIPDEGVPQNTGIASMRPVTRSHKGGDN